MTKQQLKYFTDVWLRHKQNKKDQDLVYDEARKDLLEAIKPLFLKHNKDNIKELLKQKHAFNKADPETLDYCWIDEHGGIGCPSDMERTDFLTDLSKSIPKDLLNEFQDDLEDWFFLYHMPDELDVHNHINHNYDDDKTIYFELGCCIINQDDEHGLYPSF